MTLIRDPNDQAEIDRDPNDQAEIDRDREETDLPPEDFDERSDREYIDT